MKDQILSKKPLSLGQKIERIRTFKGVKQEYLANKLGLSQPQISKIEQQEEIDENLLNQIADILEVTPDLIKNFNEDRITHVISNQYNIYNNEIKDSATNTFVFNPIEKVAELYERLLASEREKNEMRNR